MDVAGAIAALEREIRGVDCDSDDPLEPHYKLFMFYENHPPASSYVKKFTHSLELAARTFRKDARYANDVRFVRIWLKVAERAPRPEEEGNARYIMKSMRLFSRFGRSVFLMARFKEADDVYKLGISRNAAPSDRLQKKYSSFQLRMMVSVDGGDEEAIENEPIIRPILASSSSADILKKPISAQQDQHKTSKLTIYRDDSEQEEYLAKSTKWDEFGTKSSNDKENNMKATKWKGTTLPQNFVPDAPVKLQVFSDIPLDHKSDDHSSKPRTLNIPVVGKNEKYCCNLRDIYFNGAEYSFEEIRSRLPLYQVKSDIAYSVTQEKKRMPLQPRSDSKHTEIPAKSTIYEELDESSDDGHEDITRKNTETNKRQQDSAIYTSKIPMKGKLKSSQSAPIASPTINTKAALADVFDMFNSKLDLDGEMALLESDQYENETISSLVFARASERLHNSVFKDETSSSGAGMQIYQDKSDFKSDFCNDKENIRVAETKNASVAADDEHDFTYEHEDSFKGRVLAAPSGTPFISSKSKPEFNQQFMTPIPEASFEGIQGLSTIKNVRPLSIDDSIRQSYGCVKRLENDFGAPVLGLGDHTISSISAVSTRDSVRLSFPDPENSDRQSLEQELECSNSKKNDNSNVSDCNVVIPFKIMNPDGALDLANLEEIMNSSSQPVSSMEGFVDCNAMSNIINVLEPFNSAVALSEEGELGVCQFKFNSKFYVSFNILNRISNNLYLGKTPKNGLFSAEPRDLDYDFDDDDDEDSSRLFVIKVECPSNAWEFFILETLRMRLSENFLNSIAEPISCHLFSDASFLRFKHFSQNSLEQAIKSSVKGGYGAGLSTANTGGIDELLAMFWAIELIKIVEACHISGVIHGQISIENIYLRFSQQSTNYWDTKYNPKGDNGWTDKGLLLMNFESAIDTFAFDINQKFLMKSTTNSLKQFWEIRNNTPVKFEVDWYGVANIIHIMLFGSDLSCTFIEKNSGIDQRPYIRFDSKFKKAWQVSLWEDLFDILLNLENSEKGMEVSDVEIADENFLEFVEEFPPALRIHKIRRLMEEWLVVSCSKSGKSLKSLLQRVEIANI